MVGHVDAGVVGWIDPTPFNLLEKIPLAAQRAIVQVFIPFAVLRRIRDLARKRKGREPLVQFAEIFAVHQAASRASRADGDSTTSNIVPDLTPIDALVSLQIALGFFDPLSKGRAIQKRDVIGYGRKPVDRQAVDSLLDLTS